MRTRLKKHFRRISIQGFRKAGGYYFLSVLPEKLGIEFNRVFKFCDLIQSPSSPGKVVFSVLESMDRLTDADYRALEEYGGGGLIHDFEKAFDRGEKCAVAKINGNKLVCVCWLAFTRTYPISLKRHSFLLQRCFTMPRYRGQGLYPRTLAYVAGYLRRIEKAPHDIFIESSLFNPSSINGIRKAGFREAGICVNFWGRKYWRKA